MEDHDTEMSRQGAVTPRQEPRTSSPTLWSHYQSNAIPETPETTQISEPPSQPPNPPRIRIKRRRAIFPPPEQSYMLPSSDDVPLPTIELAESASDAPPFLITPNSGVDQRFLAPSSSSSSSALGRLISPPKTPIQQIFAGVDDYEASDQDWSATSHKRHEEMERPLSSLSVFSDSSASSRSSTDTTPSFGESCTSPESESSDPFVFHEAATKQSQLLSSPLKLQSSQNPRKRQKMHKRVKWTNDMDEHLWMTYITYLSDPTVTPFKTLPGSAPPLGVCHRVAREAKRSWKGPRGPLQPVAEDHTPGRFTSLDAAVMRETSAPPRTAMAPESPDTIRPRPIERSLSSNEVLRKPVSAWPRSEASTRRRLRELCKRKPMLPPHYQRLMQTRTPSPFDSSSSKSRYRSGRLSSPPVSTDYESSFSTRDLNFTLATSTSTIMQPGGPLSQLASDPQTPRQSDGVSSNQSSTRGAHQKSQSLQLGLGLGAEQSNSLRRLASPFQEIPKREDLRLGKEKPRHDMAAQNVQENASDAASKGDSTLRIHAPRPMSGSMKRRAEYQLGEELIADDVDARRSFLEGLFRDPVNDGHRRVRSRGFSLGAMRQNGPQTRHLSELFTPPSVLEQSNTPTNGESTLGHAESSGSGSNDHNNDNNNYYTSNNNNHNSSNLAPPAIKQHTRRLGSPFAPSANSGLSNTFPRSLFPHGLDSMTVLDHQQHSDAYRGWNGSASYDSVTPR